MVAAITGATSTLSADLLLVAAAGIAVGATQYGVRRGWAFFKSLGK